MTTRTHDPHDPTIAGAKTDLGSIKNRFGGGDLVAAALGMPAAFGMLALIGILLSAGAAGINRQPTLVDIDGNLETGDVVGSLVAIGTVFLSFLVGGFAEGKDFAVRWCSQGTRRCAAVHPDGGDLRCSRCLDRR